MTRTTIGKQRLVITDVDGVANDCAPTARDGFVDFQLPDALSRALITIHKNGVRLTGVEGRHFEGKLPDVGFGPFDL